MLSPRASRGRRRHAVPITVLTDFFRLGGKGDSSVLITGAEGRLAWTERKRISLWRADGYSM